MKTIKDIIFAISLTIIFLSLFIFIGIPREIERQDYLQGQRQLIQDTGSVHG